MDLEIGGDGCGSVQHCVVEPLRRVLACADRVGLPVTFFPDATGLQAIARHGRDADRRAMEDLCRTLGDAARRGHAVELHLHPQWWGAERRLGRWHLPSSANLGDLEPADREGVVVDGVRWVTEVGGRAPVAFRAGAWRAAPAGPVYDTLARHGLRIDSTVMPGRAGDGFDFRTAPTDRRLWTFAADPRVPSAGGWTEVAIATGSLPATTVWASRARRWLGAWRAPGCAIRRHGRPARGPAALDPCAWPLGALLHIAESARGHSADPLVAILHSKTLHAGAEAAIEGFRVALPDVPMLLRDAA